MTFTQDDLQRLLKRNPHITAESSPRPALVRARKNANPKPVLLNHTLGKAQDKKVNPRKFLVCIVSVRKRLSDAESLVPKWHVDCLRYAGIIEDDTAELLECRTTQRKCAKGEPEHTEIEVYEL
jgi:hypothetical protein